MSTSVETKREQRTLEDGTVQTVEVTTTYGKVKTSVLRRMNIQPFGKVSRNKDDGSVTAYEKAIEIRCYAPVVVSQNNDDAALSASTETLFEVQSAIPRCKLCGMEGHFSLRCPKRKEIDVKPVVDEQEHNRELTIKITNLADFVTEEEVQNLLAQLRTQANNQLAEQAKLDGTHYAPIRLFKCSVPRDKDGNSRCMAFVNIQQTPSLHQNKDEPTSAAKFAQKLVDLLYRQVLGHTVIEAELLDQDGSFRKRKGAPNKYDDEERWGQDKFSKHH